MQEGYPWDIMYTILPISVFVGILIYRAYTTNLVIIKSPSNMYRGLVYMGVALICFVIGLQEKKD